MIGRTASMAMAKPMFWASATMAVFMPTTWPAALTSGPPELPGLMAASVWIRPSRETPSAVEAAVLGRDDAAGDGGLAAEVEGVADGDHLVADLEVVGRAELAGTRSSVLHLDQGDVVLGRRPTRWPCWVSPSESTTVMSPTLPITWALVSTSPSALSTTPTRRPRRTPEVAARPRRRRPTAAPWRGSPGCRGALAGGDGGDRPAGRPGRGVVVEGDGDARGHQGGDQPTGEGAEDAPAGCRSRGGASRVGRPGGGGPAAAGRRRGGRRGGYPAGALGGRAGRRSPGRRPAAAPGRRLVGGRPGRRWARHRWFPWPHPRPRPADWPPRRSHRSDFQVRSSGSSSGTKRRRPP